MFPQVHMLKTSPQSGANRWWELWVEGLVGEVRSKLGRIIWDMDCASLSLCSLTSDVSRLLQPDAGHCLLFTPPGAENNGSLSHRLTSKTVG